MEIEGNFVHLERPGRRAIVFSSLLHVFIVTHSSPERADGIAW